MFGKHKCKKKDVPAATDTPLKVRFGLKTRNGYIPLSESCCELSHNGIKSSTVKEKNQAKELIQMPTMVVMSNNDVQKILDSLTKFVLRVADGKATSETEVQVLPEIAKLLLSFNHH